MKDFSLEEATKIHKKLLTLEEDIKKYEIEYKYLKEKLDELGVKDINEANEYYMRLEEQENMLLVQMKELWDKIQSDYPQLFKGI